MPPVPEEGIPKSASRDWGNVQVQAFFRSVSLGQYVHIARELNIDGVMLCELVTSGSLSRMGVANRFHQAEVCARLRQIEEDTFDAPNHFADPAPGSIQGGTMPEDHDDLPGEGLRDVDQGMSAEPSYSGSKFRSKLHERRRDGFGKFQANFARSQYLPHRDREAYAKCPKQPWRDMDRPPRQPTGPHLKTARIARNFQKHPRRHFGDSSLKHRIFDDSAQEKLAKYQCDMCHKQFRHAGNLRQHRAQVHDVGVQWHVCDRCDRPFKNAGHLKSHLAMVHDVGVRWYHCDVCAHRSKTSSDLRRHRADVHDIGVQWHCCDICDKRCKQASNLKQHRLTMHPLAYFNADGRYEGEMGADGIIVPPSPGRRRGLDADSMMAPPSPRMRMGGRGFDDGMMVPPSRMDDMMVPPSRMGRRGMDDAHDMMDPHRPRSLAERITTFRTSDGRVPPPVQPRMAPRRESDQRFLVQDSYGDYVEADDYGAADDMYAGDMLDHDLVDGDLDGVEGLTRDELDSLDRLERHTLSAGMLDPMGLDRRDGHSRNGLSSERYGGDRHAPPERPRPLLRIKTAV